MQTSSSVAPTPSLGIREFSRKSGYSETQVRRAMRELSIKGEFQGRGKATLLTAQEQERLALCIDEVELQGNDSPPDVAIAGSNRAIATPSKPSPNIQSSSSDNSSSVAGKTNLEAGLQANSAQLQSTVEADSPAQRGNPVPSFSHGTALSNSPDSAFDGVPEDVSDHLPDNTAILDQLWEARQARQPPEVQHPEPPVAAIAHPLHSSSPHSPTHPMPQDNSTQSPIPQDRIPQQPPTSNPPYPASMPPQAAAAYYDPYFDAHPPLAPSTQVHGGNHRQTLAPPTLPESYDLAQFRSEETITTLANPGAIAAQAMGAIEALVHGMDADIQQQRIHLEETQRAAQTLRLKAKQLQDKKIEYMIHSSTLGQAQQQSTLELQEALEEIQVLGKSPSDEPTSPSS